VEEECGKVLRGTANLLAGEVGEDGFGGAATAEHGTLNGGVVAMIAAKVDAGTNADGTLRRFEGAGILPRLCVWDAIATEEFPGTRDGTEPIFHLRDDETTKLVVGQLLDAEDGDGYEGFSDGSVRRRDFGHDCEIVDGAGAVTIEDERRVRHRRFFG
jgi:hypothetical protein